MKSSQKIIFIILGAGFIVRLFIFIAFFNHSDFFMEDDSAAYLNIAENVFQGRGFAYVSVPPYPPDSFRTPAYPLFLTFHRILFTDYRWAILSQCFLATLIAYLIFLLAKKYGSVRLGYITSTVFLFMPFSLIITFKFMTQVFIVLTLVLAVWYWFSFLETKRISRLIIAAVIIPITALIRPQAQYLLVVFIASFFYYCWLRKAYFSRRMFWVVPLILVSVFLMIMFPWNFRNYKVFGHYQLSSILWIQMYFYDIPDVYARIHHISYANAVDILGREALTHFGVPNSNSGADIPEPFIASPYLKDRVLVIASESPRALVESRISSFFKFFVRDGIRAWFKDFSPESRTDISLKKLVTLHSGSPFIFSVVVERLILFLLFCGMVSAFIFAFWLDLTKRFFIHFLTAVICYFAALTGMVSAALYRFQVEPFFILVGMIGLGLSFEKLKAKLLGHPRRNY